MTFTGHICFAEVLIMGQGPCCEATRCGKHIVLPECIYLLCFRMWELKVLAQVLICAEYDIKVAMAFGEGALLGGGGGVAILSSPQPEPVAVGSNYHQFPAITANRKHISGRIKLRSREKKKFPRLRCVHKLQKKRGRWEVGHMAPAETYQALRSI